MCYNTTDACFHNHEGHQFPVHNNIFYHTNSGNDGCLKSASKTATWYAAFNFTGNIVVASSDTSIFTDVSDAGPFELSNFDNNLYWRLDGNPPKFPGGVSLRLWQKLGGSNHTGEDKNSELGDPLFIDADNGNFTLRTDSPAFALGFQQLPLDQIGPQP